MLLIANPQLGLYADGYGLLGPDHNNRIHIPHTDHVMWLTVRLAQLGEGTSPVLHDQQSRCRSARPSWAETVIPAARQLGMLSGRV